MLQIGGVTALYAAYLVFLLYALIEQWHLRYVVVVCLTLHFVGLLISFTIGWDPYRVDARMLYEYVDIVQLFILVAVASMDNYTLTRISVAVALVGIVLCFIKFWRITHSVTV